MAFDIDSYQNCFEISPGKKCKPYKKYVKLACSLCESDISCYII